MAAVYLADRRSHAAEQLVAVRGDRVAHGVLEALALVLVLPAQQLAAHAGIQNRPRWAAMPSSMIARSGSAPKNEAIGTPDLVAEAPRHGTRTAC